VKLRTPDGGQPECVADFQKISASCATTIGEHQDCVKAVVVSPCNAGTPIECVTLLLSCLMP